MSWRRLNYGRILWELESSIIGNLWPSLWSSGTSTEWYPVRWTEVLRFDVLEKSIGKLGPAHFIQFLVNLALQSKVIHYLLNNCTACKRNGAKEMLYWYTVVPQGFDLNKSLDVFYWVPWVTYWIQLAHVPCALHTITWAYVVNLFMGIRHWSGASDCK